MKNSDLGGQSGREPFRVLLCGSNYGRVYLGPIGLEPRCRLTGILGRGSPRSQNLARDHGVPFYRAVAELAERIDIACVAVGSSSFEVVLQLLERGIHVLCEHPLKPRQLRRALRTAEEGGLRFHVNGHFGDLAASRAFCAECSRSAAGKPAFLTMMLADRLLYGALDVLRRGFGTLRPMRLKRVGDCGDFSLLAGRLAGIESVLQIQRSGGPDRRQLEDGSRSYLVDMTATASFPSGNLHLAALSGPVVWTPNPYRRPDSARRLWKPIFSDDRLTGSDFVDERKRANRRALEALLRDVEGLGAPAEQRPEHLREVVGAWERVARLLRAS